MYSEYTPDWITELKDNEIFVFGSNLAGAHGGGAARLAYQRFGAVWGQGVGLQGQSYAIMFLASRFDGLKYTEIAEKLGISQKTVEAQMSAAIKQLREGLKEYL